LPLREPAEVLVEKMNGLGAPEIGVVAKVRHEFHARTHRLASRSRWTRGANVKDDEVKLIVDYLARHFGK